MTLGPLGGCYLPFLPQDDVKTGRFQSCFPIQDWQDAVPLVPQAAKASKGSCSWLGRSLVAAEHLPWDWPTSERHVKNARRCRDQVSFLHCGDMQRLHFASTAMNTI